MTNFGKGPWLVESDDDDNDDWINDHTGDPELLNASLYTEGTESWNLIYYDMKRGGAYSLDIEDLPSWKTVDSSLEEGYTTVVLECTYQGANFAATLAKKMAIHQFHRTHTKPTDNPFYFVMRYDTDSYELFYNASRSEVKYMKCKFKNTPETYIEDRVLYIKMTLRSAWGVI